MIIAHLEVQFARVPPTSVMNCLKTCKANLLTVSRRRTSPRAPGLSRGVHSIPIKCKPVSKVPETYKPPSARQLVDGPDAVPLLFTSSPPDGSPSRINTFLEVLQSTSRDALVGVEHGRYDDTDSFDRIEIPLGFYLDWLQSNVETRLVDSKQLYLAQWSPHHSVSMLTIEIELLLTLHIMPD